MKWMKIAVALLVLGAISFGSSFFISKQRIKNAPVATAPAKSPAPNRRAWIWRPWRPRRKKRRQLDGLVKELKLKTEECKRRQEELDQREQRLQVAQDSLKKRAEELEAMQLKLVAPLTAVRNAQADLKRTAVAVSAQEKVNLKKLATVYEKMDPVKCARRSRRCASARRKTTRRRSSTLCRRRARRSCWRRSPTRAWQPA